MWGIEFDLVLVCGSAYTCFIVGVEINLALASRHQNWLDFIVGIEIDLNSVQESELNCFLRGDRKILVLFLVCGSKLTWFSCGGTEIDLILGWGSNWIDCSSGVEISLIFVGGIEFDLVLVFGSRVTCFLCVGSKLDSYRPKLTRFEFDDRLVWFWCGWWWWSKLTRF